MYTVYKHTTPSGKVYIGITKHKPEYRWNNGNGYRQNKHFYSAIQKYGWENIKHEILYEGLTKEQACYLEIELIAKYDATNQKHGYNHTMGGETNILSAESLRKISEANKGKHRSAETRQKISEALKGRKVENPWRKGTHLSPETRQKLSEANKGKHHSAEARKKMSESRKGRIPWNKGKHPSPEAKRKSSEAHKKAVICIETGILYSSATEAEESIGVVRENIGRAANGRRKTAGGYHWKYAD